MPASPKHAAAWLRWRQEPAAIRHNPILPTTVLALSRRLDSSSGDLREHDAPEHRWMVEIDGELVGTVGTVATSWTMGYAEIGYMIGEAHQGRGLGTLAVRALVDKLFRETDLFRVFATISVENEPSIRIATRLGFTREGLLRQHFVIGGRRVDEYLYAILRPEWQAAG